MTLTRSWIHWRKFNQLSTWQKINFKCTFCGFSFTPMSKCRKRPWNLYKYKNSFLKTYFSLIIEYGMYLKCLQKRVNLAALLVQNKPSAPIRRVENKVEFLERQFHSEKLSFVHKKETEHSFELSLSTCVFYRRIFNLEIFPSSISTGYFFLKSPITSSKVKLSALKIH